MDEDISQNAPRPMSHIGCQDILEMEPAYNGWLKYRVTLVNERLAKLPWFGSFIKNTVHKVRSPWFQKYIVIHKGCVYIFNSDTATKPQSAFSLYGYNMVVRAQHEFHRKDCLWAFKLVHLNTSSKYFSASSQVESKIWMTHINRMMRQANNAPRRHSSSASGSSHESDYSDIEEPIYGPKVVIRDSEPIEINNADEEEKDYVSYREMADNDSIEEMNESEEDERDTKQPFPELTEKKRKNSPLPALPTPHRLPILGSVDTLPQDDSDMPTQPAPQPPITPKRTVDRPLPQLPSWKSGPSTPSPTSPSAKGNWQQVPTPDDRKPPVQAKPKMPPGGVPCMLLSPTGNTEKLKPAVKTKPVAAPPAQEDDITMATWTGTKEMVKMTLLQIGEAGAFIIRDSSSDAVPNQKVLAVFVNPAMKQYKIQNTDGKFYLNDSCKFDSLLELLKHYRTNFLPNTNINLKQPYRYYSS